MKKQYITVSKESDLDWRIRSHKKYEVVGQIGDFYFVWANGHQSIVQKDRVASIEYINVSNKESRGGGILNESKRTGEKGACHRRGQSYVPSI